MTDIGYITRLEESGLIMAQIKGLAYGTQPLRDALAAYDAIYPEIEKRWATIETNEDVALTIAFETAEVRKVQEAFYEVTKDRNSLGNCYLVGICFARKIAQYPAHLGA